MVFNSLYDLFLWALALGIWSIIATLPGWIDRLATDRGPRSQPTIFPLRWMIGRKSTPAQST